MKVQWSSVAGEVLVDGIAIELDIIGEGMNVAGWWIETATYNPDDLNEVRNVILTDEGVQYRLEWAKAHRDYCRALRQKRNN